MPRTQSTNVKNMTPLWVISIFVSLTEVVTGIAVTQAHEIVQMILTIFVITFPSCVAGVFFFILWNRPYVLYPPGEFGNGVNVHDYVLAMQRRGNDEQRTQELVRKAIEAAIRQSAAISSKPDKTSPEETEQRMVKAALGKLDEQFVFIDTAPLIRSTRDVRMIPYDANRAFSQFLDEIWFWLHSCSCINIPSYTYGQTWVLADQSTGRTFSEAPDNRSLQEVGILPSMRLVVKRP